MTDQQPHTPTIEKMRKAFAISHWDVTNEYKEGERLFDEQIAAIEAAAEQRGAARALRKAAKDWRWSAWADAPRNPIAAANYTGDWLHNRADQMEGDNDD